MTAITIIQTGPFRVFFAIKDPDIVLLSFTPFIRIMFSTHTHIHTHPKKETVICSSHHQVLPNSSENHIAMKPLYLNFPFPPSPTLGINTSRDVIAETTNTSCRGLRRHNHKPYRVVVQRYTSSTSFIPTSQSTTVFLVTATISTETKRIVRFFLSASIIAWSYHYTTPLVYMDGRDLLDVSCSRRKPTFAQRQRTSNEVSDLLYYYVYIPPNSFCGPTTIIDIESLVETTKVCRHAGLISALHTQLDR